MQHHGAVISVANFKGGSGKTTVASNLAGIFGAMFKTWKILLIDGDGSNSFQAWFDTRERRIENGDPAGLRPFEMLTKTHDMRPEAVFASLNVMRERFHLAIIDGINARTSTELVAITNSDLVVIPVPPDEINFQALEQYVEFASSSVRKIPNLLVFSRTPYGEGAACYEDISSLPPEFQSKEGSQKEIERRYGTGLFEFAPVALAAREIHLKFRNFGLAVNEVPLDDRDSEAEREYRELASWILGWLAVR